MKRLLLLYNPNAGKSAAAAGLGEIITYCSDAGYTVTAVPLFAYRQRYAAGELNAENFDRTLLMGGDGTLHAAVNSEVLTLGYLPCGSANDVAHSLGISMNLNESMVSALHGEERAVDIGCFGNEKFVYVAAFGLFTEVTYSTPQKMKKDLGYLAYLLEGIKSLSDVKSYHIRIRDGEGRSAESDYIVGLVANSYSIGGFRNPMSRDTALDDGKFEGVFIRKTEDILEFNELIRDLLNGNTGSRYLDYFKTDRLELESDRKIAWTLDGDFGGETDHAQLICMKQALRIR